MSQHDENNMENIFIIDDDPDICRLIGGRLEDAGYRVIEMSSGEGVIAMGRKLHKGVLITDIVMPDCDGLEIIRFCKQKFPHIKIIAISGYKYYLKFARTFGADKTFLKPFDIDLLLAAVRGLLLTQTNQPTHEPAVL